MRNIFVFPDGNQQSFKYPDNRDIEIGEQLSIDSVDGNRYILTVTSIEQEGKNIYYHLKI